MLQLGDQLDIIAQQLAETLDDAASLVVHQIISENGTIDHMDELGAD
jgi:hypothetical protein